MTLSSVTRASRRTLVTFVLLFLGSLCGCIEEFAAFQGAQSGADGGQGGEGGSDGSSPDSSNTRDGGTDMVATDMAATDARQGDGGQTDAVADGGEEADSGYPEVCDGEDNDRDDRIDEGLPLNCCGQCGDPENTCNGRTGCEPDGGEQADAGGPADAEVSPDLGMEDQGAQQCGVPEVCDNQDNDCDGIVDEGFRLGEECREGEGACSLPGVRECGPRGEVQCSTPPGQPSPEVCDGEDNDCDGRTDEGTNCDCEQGQTQPCYTGAAGTANVGACRMGQQTCIQRRWGACEGEILPQNEVCDGIDNNCNGRTDEFAGLRGCSVGVGACARGGQRVCDPVRGEIVCNVQPGAPSPELCDGTDNNCNGTADEGFGLGGACEAGEGACQRQGRFVCDGLDSTRCNADPAPPGVEICDNIDNNCDGTVDNVAGLGNQCTNGLGLCTRQGRLVCVDGEENPVCDAQPGAPRAETCNDVDDDCDGSVDNGFNVGTLCFGNDRCRSQGVIRCTDGGNSQCIVDNVVPPAPERCDGDDDDCDGFVDEGFNLAEQCFAGVGACRQAGVVACSGDQESTTCGAIPGAPNPELCDNIDNDCDGTVDEDLGLGDNCLEGVGACARPGQVVCDGDGATTCIVPEEGVPSPELCDNIDNDCDGVIDQGLGLGERCSSGVGACADQGVTVCSPNGDTICDAIPGFVSQETCNDVDDDCDGVVDDGLSCPTWSNPVEVTPGQWIQATVTEVTVGQYISCIAAGACGRPRQTRQAHPCNWFLPVETPNRNQLPINCVTLANAQEYARWIGARVPTRAEMRAIAGGADRRPYAWGGQLPNPVCVAAHYAGCDPAGTIPVGSKDRQWDSPTGVKDLHGNVREWTESVEPNGSYDTFGGGCDDDPQRIDQVIAIPEERASYDLGFRVGRSVQQPQ